MYAIKDELAGTFGNIMVINPKVTQRTFHWLTEETEKQDCDDKRIYKLGICARTRQQNTALFWVWQPSA